MWGWSELMYISNQWIVAKVTECLCNSKHKGKDQAVQGFYISISLRISTHSGTWWAPGPCAFNAWSVRPEKGGQDACQGSPLGTQRIQGNFSCRNLHGAQTWVVGRIHISSHTMKPGMISVELYYQSRNHFTVYKRLLESAPHLDLMTLWVGQIWEYSEAQRSDIPCPKSHSF